MVRPSRFIFFLPKAILRWETLFLSKIVFSEFFIVILYVRDIETGSVLY